MENGPNQDPKTAGSLSNGGRVVSIHINHGYERTINPVRPAIATVINNLLSCLNTQVWISLSRAEGTWKSTEKGPGNKTTENHVFLLFYDQERAPQGSAGQLDCRQEKRGACPHQPDQLLMGTHHTAFWVHSSSCSSTWMFN